MKTITITKKRSEMTTRQFRELFLVFMAAVEAREDIQVVHKREPLTNVLIPSAQGMTEWEKRAVGHEIESSS